MSVFQRLYICDVDSLRIVWMLVAVTETLQPSSEARLLRLDGRSVTIHVQLTADESIGPIKFVSSSLATNVSVELPVIGTVCVDIAELPYMYVNECSVLYSTS